ncbi:Fe-S cluster assembly ATPase SufC [Vulcanisaeta souniana]|uniref:ABC transporter ATP-binding protein n=1 Tax=Vulcanisaeta souniana JCM 11219 TaxID=1293586 RepID=A0A830E6D3_9CREN|nr:Fe-S cluster assembly ATPase SufC [Vulcanisaeta souniana]BDR92506.1 ABC transporter ATP-binding protein [Vulcanisaeta souniana JCM 11219]GGI76033.1 ABC transporter ATP-binding protein [Vulcanisaeta souniana JCM 11219]
MTRLEVINLSVEVDGKRILNNVNLTVESGEVVAIMGPNGSGKTTLFLTIAGHPRYNVVNGDIRLDGESILKLYPEERVQRGVLLALQSPTPVPEVRLSTLITAMLNKRAGKHITDPPSPQAIAEMTKLTTELGLKPEHLSRGVHAGFSGGESKRAEMLQLLMYKPKVAMLDEPDSGLDVDGIAIIGRSIAKLAQGGTAILVTTHHAEILHYVKPTRVVVMARGSIVHVGGEDVVKAIESMGYERFLKDIANMNMTK